MLSKIDPRLIEETVVIKGPYSSVYGPGFDFIDFQFISSPRSTDGNRSGGTSSIEYQTNGERWYGRQSAWVGSRRYGALVSYGNKTGNDYDTGSGGSIPSSYHSQDVFVALGWDPYQDHRVEMSYLRLDQTGLEIPGQFVDINFLETDAGEFTYTIADQSTFDILTLESWYNRTYFVGDNLASGKRRQIPEFDKAPIGQPLGDYSTKVFSVSAGFDFSMSWETSESSELTFGVDLRHLHQRLDEISAMTSSNAPIPTSDLVNPGLYLEHDVSITDAFSIRTGGRVDATYTDADRTASNTDFGRIGLPEDLELVLGGEFERQFDTWALFVTSDYDLTPSVSLTAGVGHAKRPPQLVNLYAAGPFLSVLQQGFSSVFGNPSLKSERLIQVDLGLNVERERFRGSVNGFHAWINDYIAMEAIDTNFEDEVDGALIVRYVNTDLATLSGGEARLEFDVAPALTTFGTFSFVEGRDQSRDGNGAANLFLLGNKTVPGLPRGTFSKDPNNPGNPDSAKEPLPSIAPLEALLGIRIHKPGKNPDWSVEIAARIVGEQNRVATSLLERPSSSFTTMNIRGQWQVTDRWLVIGGVENVTNEFYREHLDLRTGRGVFQPGTNFYFSTELNY